MNVSLYDFEFSYEKQRVWVRIKSIRLSIEMKDYPTNSIDFISTDDNTIKKLLALKDGDKVQLKPQTFRVGKGHILLTKPIDVILAFKVEGYETENDWWDKRKFVCGFDCDFMVDTPVVMEEYKEGESDYC